eukprot:scaffold1220_cov259-Pinguiococcus_pyrenoidosus.AAC.48
MMRGYLRARPARRFEVWADKALGSSNAPTASLDELQFVCSVRYSYAERLLRFVTPPRAATEAALRIPIARVHAACSAALPSRSSRSKLAALGAVGGHRRLRAIPFCGFASSRAAERRWTRAPPLPRRQLKRSLETATAAWQIHLYRYFFRPGPSEEPGAARLPPATRSALGRPEGVQRGPNVSVCCDVGGGAAQRLSPPRPRAAKCGGGGGTGRGRERRRT